MTIPAYQFGQRRNLSQRWRLCTSWRPRFPVGGSLIANNSPEDFSEGDYTFNLTSGDGIFRWKSLTYYRLLMDPNAVRNLNQPVSSLMVNGSGFYLFGASESDVAIRVLITPAAADSDPRILKMSTDGQLVVMRYANSELVTDFSTPGYSCRPPYRCGKLGLCSPGGCYCPAGFRTDPVTYSVCALLDNSLSLPESCGDNKTLRQSNSKELLLLSRVTRIPGIKYYH
ncbi:hypothetical protein L1987_38728 [Smallanthus sonchifolius]|uniref:Uncharacterized protein n=1 Tax=Smallanthus sonchifolius TaxID=185202 RepID=A0ACB9HK08_9ASTR|nr:hypothetical protein L1987_38728 [Smallanthus sonchifolius]